MSEFEKPAHGTTEGETSAICLHVCMSAHLYLRFNLISDVSQFSVSPNDPMAHVLHYPPVLPANINTRHSSRIPGVSASVQE